MSKYSITDEELAKLPTVFAPGIFKDQVVLISGGGTGIGKATAALMARLGANLAICGRDAERLEKAGEFLRTLGGKVTVHPMTIRDPEQVSALMDDVWKQHGRLDILVNNAGGQFAQPALEIKPKGWNAVVDTNLNGTFYMMQQAARRWVDKGVPGNIINVVAVVWRGLPQVSHTCAARAGQIYLSKTVAVEWAPYKIRVNCVAPGTIATELAAKAVLTSDEAKARIMSRTPMKRLGEPGEIASVVAFLLSDAASYVTGETVLADGGRMTLNYTV